MKNKLFFVFIIVVNVNLFADIPKDDFVIFNKCNIKTIKLGYELSMIYEMFPTLQYLGEKKFSNITLKEYQGTGIIFSISAFAESERNANVRRIEILSTNYSIKRNITIGSTKEDVVSAYGVPEFFEDNSFYYYNSEDDVMELKIVFDKKGLVTSILLAAGTWW